MDFDLLPFYADRTQTLMTLEQRVRAELYDTSIFHPAPIGRNSSWWEKRRARFPLRYDQQPHEVYRHQRFRTRVRELHEQGKAVGEVADVLLAEDVYPMFESKRKGRTMPTNTREACRVQVGKELTRPTRRPRRRPARGGAKSATRRR
jgi:hypothetical protein